MSQVKKRTKRKKEEMSSKCLYLPNELLDRVDKYAEVRSVSRNVAFEELLAYVIKGTTPIPEKIFELSCKESGFPRFS